jgi:hypothetical protein
MRLSVPFNRMLPLLLSVAVKRFTRLDGINHEEVSSKDYECVSVPCLSYPAAKLTFFYSAFDCHAWPMWLNDIFPLYLINGTIVIKNVLTINCVF